LDEKTNIKNGVTKNGIATSYRWDGTSAGKGVFANQQSSTIQHNGVSVSGTGLNGRTYVVSETTTRPFVTSVKPVVLPYDGNTRAFSPSNIAAPSPSRKFYSNRRYR
jgi:hypothetical protein